MKFLTHIYRFFSQYSRSGLVFKNGGPEGGKETTEGKKEAPKGSPEDLEKARLALEGKKSELSKEIEKYLKSDNPKLKEAAKKAQEDLAKVSEDKNLDPVQVESTLNRLRSTMEFYEKSGKLEQLKKDVKAKCDAAYKEWSTGNAKWVKDYLATYPDLSPEAKKKIESLLPELNERGEGAISIRELIGAEPEAMTLEDYFMNPKKLDDQIAASKQCVDQLDHKDPGLDNSLSKLQDEYFTKSEAIVCKDLAGNLDKALKDVNSEWKYLQGELNRIGREQKKDVKDVKAGSEIHYWSAMNALKMLDKPGDAAKRAVILANLRDLTQRIIASTEGKEVPAGTPVLDQTLKEVNLTRDKYASAFLKPDVFRQGDPKLGLAEKVKSEDAYAVKGNPNFRLELTGMQLTVLPPGTTVRVVHTDVAHVETNDKKTADYVRVQVNPPNGPFGLVAANLIDFSKPVKKGPEKGRQPAA